MLASRNLRGEVRGGEFEVTLGWLLKSNPDNKFGKLFSLLDTS